MSNTLAMLGLRTILDICTLILENISCNTTNQMESVENHFRLTKREHVLAGNKH